MITSYQEGKIDMAIGLTEGWINGLATNPGLYKLVGTYVKSPLTWAISAGFNNHELTSAEQLKGKKIGVSRIGSGSYVMSFVFADNHKWLSPSFSKSEKKEDGPFEFIKLDTFKGLRDGVNNGLASAFMWELFTTKKFYDSKELKQIGSIETPWPSWLLTTSPTLSKRQVNDVVLCINQGVDYFENHFDESMSVIQELGYSLDDAKQWRKTVQFSRDVGELRLEMVDETISRLRKAGLMQQAPDLTGADMI